MKKTAKKAAVGFIFITLLIDITGWGIILPVVPKLVGELIHGDITEAATYGGWLGFAYAFTQFICAPMIGNLSDRYEELPTFVNFAPGILDWTTSSLHWPLLLVGYLSDAS